MKPNKKTFDTKLVNDFVNRGIKEEIKILERLYGEDYLSADEIAKSMYSNRMTISKYLWSLYRQGKVNIKIDGKKVMYKVRK